jgi:predicted transcriptional regulator
MAKRVAKISRASSSRSGRLLTEVELELMNIVWKLGEASVSDVIDNLPTARKLAYTSVSTMLRILEGKGVLSTRKEGRGHVYLPRIAKEEYEAKTLRHVVDKVFDGAPSSLVRRLLQEEGLSAQELQSIQELLNEKLPR